MRKWILKETGETRIPKEGEYYVGKIDDGKEVIILGQGLQPCERRILSVTISEELDA